MMSLFDVIRYPISDIPKEEELRALPTMLYNIWLSKEFPWAGPVSPAVISTWFMITDDSTFKKTEVVASLRKAIEEYDSL